MLYLASYLRGRGHDNTIVCRKGSPLDKEAARLGFSRLHLPFLGEWDPVSAFILRLSARKTAHPAVLHAHTGHTAALSYLASRFSGPKWVVHRRVDFPVSNSLSRKLKYARADKIFAVSAFIRKLLSDQGLSLDKISVVPDCIPWNGNGTTASMIGPASPEQRIKIRKEISAEWNVPSEAVWIGNMAALVPHKDQATLIRSMAEVRREAGKVHLFIIGEGPLRRELENLSESLGVSSNVHFTGYQAQGIRWLQALDLFVLSSWGEGMGSVLLEATACRLPIVATTAGGIPEVIEDRDNGLLVPPRNWTLLAQAIVEMIKNKAEAERMTQSGLLRLKDFAMERCGRLVEDEYGKILLNGGHS